jgi:hypothetical protein
MEPHYPNPTYAEPCVEYDFCPRPKPEKSVFSSLKLAAFTEIEVVSPVGRRPAYPKHYMDISG